MQGKRVFMDIYTKFGITYSSAALRMAIPQNSLFSEKKVFNKLLQDFTKTYQ